MVGQRIEPAAPDLQPAATEPPPADVKPEADEMPKPQPMGPMRPTLVASAPPPGAA
jgi:hypothetical protein